MQTLLVFLSFLHLFVIFPASILDPSLVDLFVLFPSLFFFLSLRPLFPYELILFALRFFPHISPLEGFLKGTLLFTHPGLRPYHDHAYIPQRSVEMWAGHSMERSISRNLGIPPPNDGAQR